MFFHRDIGIDLGTANTLVYVRGKGIVINEPSVVAINKKTGQVLAVGEEARKMVGKTPAHIIATKPLIGGVVSDFEITEQMLRYFIDKVFGKRFFPWPQPRLVIGIPSGVTEVERKAVEDAAKNAGAGEVYLVEEPMAAAIGSRLPVQEAGGNMIVDIGGGTTDVAIISLGGIVTSRSIRIGGDEFDEAIINYIKRTYSLMIGERTAEEIKVKIGSAIKIGKKPQTAKNLGTSNNSKTKLAEEAAWTKEDDRKWTLGEDRQWKLEEADPEKTPESTPQEEILYEYQVRGRDMVTGLPKLITVTADEINSAIAEPVAAIVDTIKICLEKTPPELAADIMDRGIMMAGGGSLLHGFDKLISEQTGMPVHISDGPLNAVALGAGKTLDNIDVLKRVALSNKQMG